MEIKEDFAEFMAWFRELMADVGIDIPEGITEQNELTDAFVSPEQYVIAFGVLEDQLPLGVMIEPPMYNLDGFGAFHRAYVGAMEEMAGVM